MVALGLACFWLLQVSCGPSPPAEAAVEPRLTAFRDALVVRHVLSGTLVAEAAVDLAAPDVGIYPLQIRWMADQGALVAAGDRVLELDNSSLVQRLEELERQVDQSETGLDIAVSTAVSNLAQAQFDVLQKDTALTRARIEADIPEGIRSSVEYARLQLELQKAELEKVEAVRGEQAARETGGAEIEIARLALERAQRELQSVGRKIERLELRAPGAGIVVGARNWNEDRIFEAGDSVFPGNTIARLPNLETLYVRAELFDVDDGAIEPGLEAVVELDAVPGVAMHGSVRAVEAIAQQPSRRSLRRVFGVVVDIEPPEGVRLLPGMSARVVVERTVESSDGEEAPVLVVRAAVDLSATPPRVSMADGEVREVRVGSCSNTHCAIEEGVDVGEVLVPYPREAEF